MYVGYKHSKEAKEKMSERHKGLPCPMKGCHHTEETKKKLSLSHKGKKNPKTAAALTGRTLSDEHKKNISASMKNNMSEERRQKLILSLKHIRENKSLYPKKRKPHTEKTKEKIRVAILNRIEKRGGGLHCFVGNNETRLLDEREKKDYCKIIRQYRLKNLGYTVDGYCAETNTVYEVYEKYHLSRIDRDFTRQQNIKESLNCAFIIIWDN